MGRVVAERHLWHGERRVGEESSVAGKWIDLYKSIREEKWIKRENMMK